MPTGLDPEDRRVIYSAIVNCSRAQVRGRSDILPQDIVGYVSVFLTQPSDGSKVSVEVVDVTGPNGRGSLDTVFRSKFWLVR